MLRIRILLLGLLLFGIAGLASAQQDFVVGPLTAQAAACPVSPGQQSQSTSALTLATMNAGGATFTIGASAFSGTVSFFGSADGALTWAPLNVFPSNSTTPVTTATAAGVWQVNVAAYTNVCMVATTYSSGTITATIRKATVSARAGGGGGGGAGVASLNTLTGAVTLAAGTNISLTPAGNTITVADTSITGLTTGSLTKAGSATTVVNSLCDEGITTANTLTCTDTSGIAAPGFVGTGTGAGFDALVQGADNCVAKQPAGSVCWEAPASGVTSYHGLYAVTPSTGIPHYAYSAPTITETISAIVGADCPTCIISAGAITNNVLPKGNGAQGLVNSSITDNATNVTTTDTGGYVAPVFTANGATAGFMDFAQGTTSAAVAPCNTLTSICIQAPTAVTSYLINLAGAAATGLPHYANAANVITETISAVNLASADVTGSLPLNQVASPTGAVPTFVMGTNTLDFTYAQTANNVEGVTFEEATAATGGTAGNQFTMEVSTLAGSTASPLNLANSLNGSQTLPTLYMQPLWNTTGVVDAGIFENITNTASGIGSAVLDTQLGGTGFFKLATQSATPATAALDGPNIILGGSLPEITTPGTTPYLNMNTLVNAPNNRNKCTFALTTGTFTLALSPVSLCAFVLPNAATTWYWSCTLGWSNVAGTTPTFAEGVNWSQAPSTAFQMGQINTSNGVAGTSAPIGSALTTATTTNSNILVTGTIVNSATLFTATMSGTFTSSATSGTFSPTLSLTGTGATGTAVGGCTIQ